MELNLRKARKLEAKILAYVNAMSPSPTVKVRAMADETERHNALAAARRKYLADVDAQESLILIRFYIRKSIAVANSAVGINDLINYREQLTAQLEKSNSGVDVLDYKEAADLAQSKKLQLEKGAERYGETSVTFALPVTTEDDVKSFKSKELQLRKHLEEVEDNLSQKNLGAKIVLSTEYVNLLQSVGLL